MAKFCGKDLLIQRGATATAWAASTAYTLGQYRLNGANVYVVLTAGTSAASGGPTGTATSGITDGTVTWGFHAVGFQYTTVAAMRTSSLTLNNEQVDVTTKDDTPWRQLIDCGIKSMSLSAAGVFTDAAIIDTILADLTTAGGSIDQYRIISGAGDIFAGQFLVASLERSGEYNGAEQYTLSFESAGAITYYA